MSNIWTAEEALSGFCNLDDVGSPKPPNNSSPQSVTPLDLQSALQAAYKKMGSEKNFVDWAAKNPGLVYPQMIKMGIAITAKTAPPTLPKLNDLTDEQITALSSADLKRVLLNWAEIQTTEQLDALR